ncbi:hypothetical protein E8E12_010716 [Didymella heteroderae]|uniref:BTB domain-containing protein n=1 Tax=Didymella heteroderae TaxID=1769908 RepID=A0A9P5C6P4_9PLEO|nr:hypothetical protein E8E12_010716 [Didymella heteroderae]
MKDCKGKKDKKKQAMTEPVDLEAGEHIADPDVPTIAKAVYGSRSPSKANSEVPKNEEEASSTRDGAFGLHFTETAASDTTETQTPRACKKGTPAQDPVSATEVYISNCAATKVKARDSKTLRSLVFEMSVTPQPPKINTKNVENGTMQKFRLCPLISAWSIEPSKGPTAAQSARSKASDKEQQQKIANTSQLLSLSPFDHKSFSRFDNIRRQTKRDFGSLIELQTNDGKFSYVHLGVLRQIPRFKKFVDKNPRQLANTARAYTLQWRPDSDFDGVSTTYIHWLYNGNLPTAVIDVSDEHKIGDVLRSLVEEYAIGSRVRDGCYMNAIMDAFITLQVRTRWLALGSVVEIAYKNTAEVSMLRLMLADMHAFILVDETEDFDFDLLENMPKAFVIDVLESVVTLKPNGVNEWYWYLKDTGKTYHV